MSRYKKKGNVVLDTQTGLEWQAKMSGRMNWHEAIDYAKSLGENWRLPTIKELLTLIDYEKAYPATMFPGHKSAALWSSSVCADHTGYAWLVDFDYGYVSNLSKAYGYRVRCVRYKP